MGGLVLVHLCFESSSVSVLGSLDSGWYVCASLECRDDVVPLPSVVACLPVVVVHDALADQEC